MTEGKVPPPYLTKNEFYGFAEEELAIEISEHPDADPVFPEEIPTSPELRVQIQKNITKSKETVSQAGDILRTLEKRSTNPPKL